MNRFKEKLGRFERQNRLRGLNLPRGIDFSSNDYLGLRSHPVLKQAALEAIEGGMPFGAGGSRLLRGHMREHADLEEYAAAYFGAGKALYCATGYQANLALFNALPSRHDVILFDGLIHASARDGIQASAARHVRVPHNDLEAFEAGLRTWRDKAEILWVAVESVYSMDGDLAPLDELRALCVRYDAYLIVDEAHGTGVFGSNGKGLSEGLPHDRIITLHTCGKALGVAGGLICAPEEVIAYLINTARPFIYSTAPPPLQALLVHKALEIAQAEPWRRDRLMALRDKANALLPVPDSPSQIIPVPLGDDARAVQVAAALQDAGYDIRAIRPPTVPEGTARLRVSLNAGLQEEALDGLARALSALL